MIVTDGEGATKFIEVNVNGARSKKEAEAAGRTICNSLLVKTAIHGEDANWGRILAAVGRSGIHFNPDMSEIFFGGLRILGKNYNISFSEKRAKKILRKKEIMITVDLHAAAIPQHYGHAIYRKAISILMRVIEVSSCFRF